MAEGVGVRERRHGCRSCLDRGTCAQLLGRDEPARVHPVNIVVQPGLVLPADRREHDRDRTVLSLARLGGRGPAQLPQATGQSRLRS
jgi:hypothetical protein